MPRPSQYGTQNPGRPHTPRHPATHETEIVQPKPNSSPTNTEKKTASLLPLLTPCKKKRGSHHRGTDVGPASHAPPLGIYTGPQRLMGHNENGHKVTHNTHSHNVAFGPTQPSSSQFFPEMSSFRGKRVFSSSRSCQANRYARGKLGFVICNLLCFTEI